MFLVKKSECSYNNSNYLLFSSSYQPLIRWYKHILFVIIMAKTNINATVAKYDHFINNVLREDLRILHLKLTQVNAELSDLIQQKHALKIVLDKSVHPNGFKSQVNIGCNFFMEASVTDTSRLLMNIGLNYYLDLTNEEALKYLDARIKAFELKSEELCNKAAETKAHIKLMLVGVSELENQKDTKNS